MASTVKDVMSTDIVTRPATTTMGDAARLMRDRDIGDVLVTGSDERLTGIVTDRDLVVRCLAGGANADTTIERACSVDLATVSPDSSVDEAISLMRERSLRRVPVVDKGRAVGIVTLGDLAIERDPSSALGDISAAAPNN
jgi:CBS domain-containing protein